MEREKPTFIVDLEADKLVKPLPYQVKKKRTRVIDLERYPKYEEEFFDTVKDCAIYIDRMTRVEDKIYFTNRLNSVFVSRDKKKLMRLFRDIMTKTLNS